MEFRTIPPSFIDVGPKLGVLSQMEITRKFGPEAENSCRKTEGIQSYTRIWGEYEIILGWGPKFGWWRS